MSVGEPAVQLVATACLALGDVCIAIGDTCIAIGEKYAR
jgi:hypothetical protein